MGSLFSPRSRHFSFMSVLVAFAVGGISYFFVSLLISILFSALVFALAYLGFSARGRERELQLSQNFLETVVGQLPVAMFCKDIKNNYRFNMWNKKAEELWGLKREEVIGKSDYDFFPRTQADGFREKDEDTVKKGDMLVIPEELVTSPVVGDVYVRTRKVIIRNDSGEALLLLGISEDITEQKRSAEIIEQQRLQMVNTAKMTALGEMAGGIAHEINNPLAIIEIYASQLSMLSESDRLDSAKVNKAAGVISATVDRIARITKGLRSFARDAEHDPIVNAQVRQILTETMEFCQEKFAKNGVKLDLSMKNENLEMNCRPVQISQVLLNLMNNSFDAVIGKNSPWVKIEADEDEKQILISVTDSGPGISEEIADKIMQPFFTTKSVGKGTGLGLSISQGIIRSHHGELSLDSASKNTRFVIAIPK